MELPVKNNQLQKVIELAQQLQTHLCLLFAFFLDPVAGSDDPVIGLDDLFVGAHYRFELLCHSFNLFFARF